MRVPFVDLRAQHDELRSEIDAAISGAIDASDFIGGQTVERFESEFARYLGLPNVVGTSSGTAALYLVLQALGIGRGADLITIGPGSLYTSILPNLLVDGMLDALKAADAPKVYICNVATQRGETDGFTVSDHLRVMQEHVGDGLFDYMVVNSNFNYPLPSSAVAAGNGHVIFDRDKVVKHGLQVVAADVVAPHPSTHHDPELLSRVLVKQICGRKWV